MVPVIDARPNSPAAIYTDLLTHIRVYIEQTFGRVKHIWQCINHERTLCYEPEKAVKIITACAVLYNFEINEGYLKNCSSSFEALVILFILIKFFQIHLYRCK